MIGACSLCAGSGAAGTAVCPRCGGAGRVPLPADVVGAAGWLGEGLDPAARVMQAVCRLADAGRPVSGAEIMRGTGLPKTTTNRVVERLAALGLLEVSQGYGTTRPKLQRVADERCCDQCSSPE